MTTSHLAIGKLGELYAAAYLQQNGYQLVGANFSLPVGRNRRDTLVTAELDLVAYDGATLCFIEVKARRSDWFAAPEVNVDRRKRRQIARAARAYRRMFALEDDPYRYDVVTVVLGEDEEPQVELLKNFWREDQLRKRRWTQHFYE
jgi:putative endonuclease